jgi:hypothetical protein
VRYSETLNRQQGGFQNGLPCLMTSFILRESIQFARELCSKTYVCFMDGRKAFHTVWYKGMLYKLLCETCIDKTTFLAFNEMYTHMASCVRYQGKHSDWFNVLQGTRQGGKTSTILYLLYINGLLDA